MSRFALAAFMQCAREMKDKGSFTYVRGMAPIKELREAFAAVQKHRHSEAREAANSARAIAIRSRSGSMLRHPGMTATLLTPP